MTDEAIQPTVQIRRPIFPLLVAVPSVCFLGALLTDIAYVASAEIMWADFSAWLLTVGVIIGAFAAIAGLIDFIRDPGLRQLGGAWLHFGGSIVVLALAGINTLIHTRDAWTSVMPVGLILSIVTVLVLLVTSWFGWTTRYQRAGAFR